MNHLATITKSIKDFFKGIIKMLSDPVGGFILMGPVLVIGFVVVIVYFVTKDVKEEKRKL